MKLWMSRRYMQNLVWSKRESRLKGLPIGWLTVPTGEVRRLRRHHIYAYAACGRGEQ